LGLAICKQIVTLFHGTIGVQSTEGKGSIFTFTALFNIAPEQPPPQLPLPSVWRVLVVSSLPTSRNIFEYHLQACKIPYSTATTQEEAVQILISGNSRDRINCVIIDLFSHLELNIDLNICMPFFGGRRVVLVANSLQRPHLLKEFPFATFLIKPVNIRKLVEALLGRSVQPKEKLSTQVLALDGNAHVLIVEGFPPLYLLFSFIIYYYFKITK
jgi:hypothetical protein